MDAKAEAEKRWAVMDTAQIGSPGAGYAKGFEAGAAWALREFGDMLDRSVPRLYEKGELRASLEVHGWSAEAHHIADGIEES